MYFTRLSLTTQILRSLVICLILLVLNLKAISQTVIFTEGFEAGFPPIGWSIKSYTFGGANEWVQYSQDKKSGSYSAAVFPNVSNINAWLFTKSLNLLRGKYYVLSYYCKIESNTSLKITIGNNADNQSQQKIVRNNFLPSGSFDLIKDTIICEQTGTYYIGFNNYSTHSYFSKSLIDEVSLMEFNLPSCNTVSAGTVSSSVNTICANTPFTISNTNATINTTGLQYAWQKSTDGVNWININNGYLYQPSIQVRQTVSTYYRLTDTCINSGVSDASNQLLVNNSSYLGCYCTPAYINCAFSMSFSNVTILNSPVNNTSTCSPNGYGNFTAVGNANVYRNQNIYIQHTLNNPNNNKYTVEMWADLNHDGSFEESEYAVSGPFSVAAGTSQYFVPGNALIGETRLRLRIRYYSGTSISLGPCASNAWSGETEDYKITIGDVTDCTGSVSAGIISAVNQTCPNTNFSISAANPTTYQGLMKYAWQKSTDSINWNNLNNTSYLINPLTISENNSAYYRLTDTCLVSGQSSVSNSIAVATTNIFNCYCIPRANNCSTISLDSVSFNTIHNSSTCIAGGYSDFTNINTTIDNGTNTNIYLKFKSSATITKYAGVWIDINRNGSFESAEKVFSGISTTNMTGIINIPFNVISGETLMRIVVGNNSNLDPCAVGLSQGEAEDYKIILNVVKPVSNKFAYYVKQSAAGLNDGTSWANAFNSLATAFSYSRAGDTIRVAKGIYKPGITNTNSFQLKDSVIVWGGFADTGTPTDAERNFSDYQSIMSGEIGFPDDSTDNIKIILQATNVKDFIVDGFIIENGYCNSVAAAYGSVYLNAATGILKNIVIRKNYNFTDGTIVNAINSKLTILNCFIENNEAASIFRKASVFYISAKSDVTVINSVLAKNKTGLLFDQSYSNVRVLNSTIFKNYGYSNIYDTSNLVAQNSIFYYNGNNYYNDDSTEFKKDIYSAIEVNNTITEIFNSASTKYYGNNPKFIDTARIAGLDDKYFTTDDGLRVLNPCSPAINTGNNNLVVDILTDIAGSARIKNGVTDLGAYEVQEIIAQQPNVLYVNKNATGLNNGSSWQHAFTDLQTAFYYCSDSIKVAKGTYPVSLTDANATYRLTNNRVVLGGYPNTGTPTNNDINTLINPTQIDGKINATQKCNNIITSMGNDSTCRMIGFEIINSAKPVYPSKYATTAMKIAHKSSPYFENIKLDCITNQAFSLILVDDQSKPLFYKCTFYNGYNSQGPDDAGRFISINKNSAPLFLKSYVGKDTTASIVTSQRGALFIIIGAGGVIDSCIFFRAGHSAIQNQNSNTIIRNTIFTKTSGRNILNTRSAPVVTNCVFNDTAYTNDFNGGSIANYDNTNATYINCSFNNSYSGRYGGACTNEGSLTVFKNCIFKNCSARFDPGTIYNNVGQLKLINCIGYNSNAGKFLINTGGSAATIINSTIIAPSISGIPVILCQGADSLKLYNSIIWRHGYNEMISTGNDISTANNNNPAICDIRNSILFRQGNTVLNNSSIGINPRLIDLLKTEGLDNLNYTDDDGLKPCTCSPAINAGNTSLNPEISDILNKNRVYNGTIDIGAYEVQDNTTTDKTFYVKENASTAGNGLSWATAYNSLQKAVINNCADTIKIAKGLYKPAIMSRDSTFNIYRGAVILGGYPDFGTPGDTERNINANPTILSGDIGVPNDSTDNSLSVMRVHCPDTTVLLDGLIIEKGNFNINSNLQFGGGGIQSIGNRQLIINNCIVQNNYGTYGGGIYSHGANLNLLKTVVRNNNSNHGGGFFIWDNGGAGAPILNFRNSVLCTNKGGAGVIWGNGVIANQNNNRFENVIVYKNEGDVAAGFYFIDNPYVKIVNCIFAKNYKTSTKPGNSILVNCPYNGQPLNTSVFNTTFTANTVVGLPGNFLNNDFNWENGSIQQEAIPLQNVAFSSFDKQAISNVIPNNATVDFKDIENGAGNDNTWMTADDGLQLTECSQLVDNGSNFYVQNIPLDILDSNRIKNLKVDIGPYEKGSFTPLTPTATITARDTIICTGGTVTFYANATGANDKTTYQWKINNVNAGYNISYFVAPDLSNGDVVKVEVTINNPCVNTQTITSNSITMQVSSSLLCSAGPVEICAGGAGILTSNIQGAIYQWQQNTGTGFVDIHDNNNFTGTNTSSLQLVNVPSAWYGYQFRCKVDNSSGNKYALHFTNYWTGKVSMDWNEPNNWSCKTIPDENTDVIINGGTVFLNVDGICRSLKMISGTKLTMPTGINLKIMH